MLTRPTHHTNTHSATLRQDFGPLSVHPVSMDVDGDGDHPAPRAATRAAAAAAAAPPPSGDVPDWLTTVAAAPPGSPLATGLEGWVSGDSDVDGGGGGATAGGAAAARRPSPTGGPSIQCAQPPPPPAAVTRKLVSTAMLAAGQTQASVPPPPTATTAPRRARAGLLAGLSVCAGASDPYAPPPASSPEVDDDAFAGPRSAVTFASLRTEPSQPKRRAAATPPAASGTESEIEDEEPPPRRVTRSASKKPAAGAARGRTAAPKRRRAAVSPLPSSSSSPPRKRKAPPKQAPAAVVTKPAPKPAARAPTRAPPPRHAAVAPPPLARPPPPPPPSLRLDTGAAADLDLDLPELAPARHPARTPAVPRAAAAPPPLGAASRRRPSRPAPLAAVDWSPSPTPSGATPADSETDKLMAAMEAYVASARGGGGGGGAGPLPAMVRSFLNQVSDIASRQAERDAKAVTAEAEATVQATLARLADADGAAEAALAERRARASRRPQHAWKRRPPGWMPRWGTTSPACRGCGVRFRRPPPRSSGRRRSWRRRRGPRRRPRPSARWPPTRLCAPRARRRRPGWSVCWRTRRPKRPASSPSCVSERVRVEGGEEREGKVPTPKTSTCLPCVQLLSQKISLSNRVFCLCVLLSISRGSQTKKEKDNGEIKTPSEQRIHSHSLEHKRTLPRHTPTLTRNGFKRKKEEK